MQGHTSDLFRKFWFPLAAYLAQNCFDWATGATKNVCNLRFA